MLLTSLVTTFTFFGGKPSQLASEMSGVHDDLVVIQVTSDTKFGDIRFTYSDRIDFGKAISRNTGLVQPDPAELVFHSSSYPGYLVMANFFPQRQEKMASGSIQIDAKRVTTLSGGYEMKVSDIAGLKLSKPLKTHWFLDRLEVVFYASKEKESTWLKAIALAVGGSFFESPTEYRIDFNPKEYRKRASVAYDQLVKLGRADFTAIDAEFNRLALEGLSDKAIAEAFASPTSYHFSDVRLNSKAHELALQKLVRDYPEPKDGKGGAGSVWVWNNVDFSGQPQYELRPLWRVMVTLPVKGKANHRFSF